MSYAVSSDYKSLIPLKDGNQPPDGYRRAQEKDIGAYILVSDDNSRRILSSITDAYLVAMLDTDRKKDIRIFEFARRYANQTPKSVLDILCKNIHSAFYFARDTLKGRFELAESIFATDAEIAYHYANDVLKDRFPQGEAIIAESAEYSHRYAKNVIKGRFEAGEEAIIKSAQYAYLYAKNVIKDRFEAGEEAIATDADFAYSYARDVLKGRFELGEAEIDRHENVSLYYNTLYLESGLKNQMP